MLYHPLTPFFVLFCNVVATSDSEDFHTLKCVTDELEGLVELSSSIAKLQMLFKSFIDLCEGLVSSKRQRVISKGIETGLRTLQPQQGVSTDPSNQTPTTHALSDSLDNSRTQPPTSAPLLTPSLQLKDLSDGTLGNLDLGWGLFDVQPTLDWLDADFSFFDNEQYHQG